MLVQALECEAALLAVGEAVLPLEPPVVVAPPLPTVAVPDFLGVGVAVTGRVKVLTVVVGAASNLV